MIEHLNMSIFVRGRVANLAEMVVRAERAIAYERAVMGREPQPEMIAKLNELNFAMQEYIASNVPEVSNPRFVAEYFVSRARKRV